MTIVLLLGKTESAKTGDSIDLTNIWPFFLSGSISWNKLGLRRVIRACKSTTIKSGHRRG